MPPDSNSVVIIPSWIAFIIPLLINFVGIIVAFYLYAKQRDSVVDQRYQNLNTKIDSVISQLPNKYDNINLSISKVSQDLSSMLANIQATDKQLSTSLAEVKTAINHMEKTHDRVSENNKFYFEALAGTKISQKYFYARREHVIQLDEDIEQKGDEHASKNLSP